MSTSVMNQYRVRRQDLPLTLYRVDRPGANTTYSQRRGFKAASTFTPIYVTGLRNAVENHLHWPCTTPSPFISTFSNRQHALKWALKWSRNNDNEICRIVKITIEAEHGVTVCRAADLIDGLGIDTPHRSESEYLCFHRIPSNAIMREESVSYQQDDSDSDSDSDDGYYRR